MCASRSVLNRPERRNESKVDRVTILMRSSLVVTVGRSNSPPISLIVDLAEL